VVNAAVSGSIALVVALLCTRPFIGFLVRHQYGQFIHDDLVHHHVKRGKPTMGGVVVIAAVLVGYLGSHLVLLAMDAAGMGGLTSGGVSPSGLLVLFLLTGLGLVGFLDDWTKIRRERSLGLTSRQKLAGQSVVTVLFALGRCCCATRTAGRPRPPPSPSCATPHSTWASRGRPWAGSCSPCGPTSSSPVPPTG
jgi:phospho-N-acetylmuramoyl-pentapeptide-transferase